MSAPAAITAQLVDVRNVGMHKCIKLTLHVPAELAGQVMAAFGWPTSVDPVPVALARLNLNGDGTASLSGGEAVTPAGGGLPARPKERNKLSQQAGACCSDPRFQKWLGAIDRDEAANIVRLRCEVGSRSEIISGTPAGELWSRIYDRFRIWCDVPELAAS